MRYILIDKSKIQKMIGELELESSKLAPDLQVEQHYQIVAFNEVLNSPSITGEELAKIIDNIAYKCFKAGLGDNEPTVGFREVFPVIQDINLYLFTLNKK